MQCKMPRRIWTNVNTTKAFGAQPSFNPVSCQSGRIPQVKIPKSTLGGEGGAEARGGGWAGGGGAYRERGGANASASLQESLTPALLYCWSDELWIGEVAIQCSVQGEWRAMRAGRRGAHSTLSKEKDELNYVRK